MNFSLIDKIIIKMNFLRVSNIALNMNLIRSVKHYHTRRGDKFMRVVWNGSNTSGGFLYFDNRDLYEDFYEKEEPQMYKKLLTFLEIKTEE